MRGTKKIEFDFAFEFSEGGSYVSANCVTVTAPSIAAFGVHQHMRASVVASLFGAAKMAAELHGVAEARRRAIDEEEAAAASSEPIIPTGAETLDQIALGLGPEKFTAFAAYVRGVLTNNAKLARVGQGSTPITDETWERIEEAGGMEAVAEILGTFAGFFVPSPTSPMRSGTSSAHSSSSDSRGASRSTTRSAPRSRS